MSKTVRVIGMALLICFAAAPDRIGRLFNGSNTAGAGTAFGAADVRGYGITPDIGKSDTIAIQAAIDAAEANDGGTVYIPGGDWSVTTALTVQKSNIIIVLAPDCHVTTGNNNCFVLDESSRVLSTSALAVNVDDNASTITLVAGETANFTAGETCVIYNDDETCSEIITISSIAGDDLNLKGDLRYAYTTAKNSVVRRIDWIRGFEISGGLIEGNDVNSAVYMGYCLNPVVKNVRIQDYGNAIYIAGYTNGAKITDNDISNCNSVGNGILSGGHTFENDISHNHIRRVGTGIRLYAADGCRVIGNDIAECNVGGGVTLESSSYNTVASNEIHNVVDDGIGINSSVVGTRNSFSNIITNNVISRCGAGGIQCQNVTHWTRIIGNTIEYCGESGILQESGSFVNISNNIVYKTGLDPGSVSLSGISLGEGHSIVCAFNQSSGNIGYGIRLASTADYPCLFGNVTYDNDAGNYQIGFANAGFPATNGLQAFDANGLKFYDDGGNLGINLKDGGDVNVPNDIFVSGALGQRGTDFIMDTKRPNTYKTAYALKVYDANGTLMGYVPVYPNKW
ncbi:MAG: right-handed parallel beta-helix repeat-containing protein [Planctomycetota bacterium]